MLTHFLIPIKIFHLVKRNMKLLSHVLDEMYKEENQGIRKIIVVLDEESAAVRNNDSNVYAEATPSEEPPDNSTASYLCDQFLINKVGWYLTA